MPDNTSWFLGGGMFGICDVSRRAWRIKVVVAVPCATQSAVANRETKTSTSTMLQWAWAKRLYNTACRHLYLRSLSRGCMCPNCNSIVPCTQCHMPLSLHCEFCGFTSHAHFRVDGLAVRAISRTLCATGLPLSPVRPTRYVLFSPEILQVSEQMDSLRVLYSDPVDYLVTPRVLASMIAGPILNVLCFCMGGCCCKEVHLDRTACVVGCRCRVVS